MNEELYNLPVSEIKLDLENPRIQTSLEKYGDNLKPELLHLALMGGGDRDPQASFDKLSKSILANGGIKVPIIVRKVNGEYICTEGNTRLSIYTNFKKKGKEGNWDTIPSLVSENPSEEEIEITRMTSHIVPARQWHAYAKAAYLHELRFKKNFDYAQMIAVCGGNKSSIDKSIDAYTDMNENYRDRLDDDTQFDEFRFSGFEELQKAGVKESIFNAGFSLNDFGDWIRFGQIKRLENVRLLKKVLSDPDATEIFTTGGINSIQKAYAYIENKNRDEDDVPLLNATLYQLAKTTTKKIDGLTSNQIEDIKNNVDDSDSLSELENLYDTLNATFFSDNG